MMGRNHVVPPICLTQDMFHELSYGKRDGYVILYTPENQIVLAPHRFNGIQWAGFATRSRSLITLGRDSAVTCYYLL